MCSFFPVSNALPVSPIQFQGKSEHGIWYTTLVFLSLGTLYFGDGNSFCSVRSGRFATLMLCFFRIRVKGSVIPRIHERTANPFDLLFFSIMPIYSFTSSSGLGVRQRALLSRMISIVRLGYNCWPVERSRRVGVRELYLQMSRVA